MTDATPVSIPKKSSLGKWILRLLLIAILLFVVAIAALYLFRNSLVRAGVIRGGQIATDQNTSLNLADLSLGGSLKLDTLDIDNLKGYSTPKILVMKSCDVSVQPGSLLTKTVQVDHINIKGLEFTLEQNGMKNNLNELLTIIQKKTAATGKSENTPPGKQLKIGVVKLEGTKVHVRGLVTMDLDLPDLEIKDPMNPDGRPMKIADLVGRILVQLGKQVIENPSIPGSIKDAMKDAEAIVSNIRGELEKNVNQLIKDVKIPEVPKDLQNVGKDAGKNLEKLNPFGGKKEGQ